MVEQQTRSLDVNDVPVKRNLFARHEAKLQIVVMLWAFAASYIFTLQVIVPGYRKAFVLFVQILNGSADSPFAYRLLVPFLIKGLGIPLSRLLSPQTMFVTAYVIYSIAAIVFSALVLFRLFRLWYDDLSSLLGAMMYCLLVAVASHHDMFQPWSQLEPGLYAVAIILGVRCRIGWALILTIIATLNRETGLFVPLLFCAVLPGRLFDRKRILWLAVLGAVWLSVFLGLRVLIGPRPDPYTIAWCWHDNLRPMSLAISLAASAAFFSVVAPAVFGWARTPLEIRRSALVLFLFVPLILLYGLWWEVRHWLSVACILLPFAISGVQAIRAKPTASATAV